MDAYVNPISSTPILMARHVSSGQNSLQGALNGSDSVQRTSSASSNPGIGLGPSTMLGDRRPLSVTSLDQDMQRQLDEYNRSITVIVWYKADTEPIRLQHMNPTFPYFQLLQLPSVTADLRMAPGSYIDAWDRATGKWEQHTVSTVRLVASQQRLLYKTRRNLLDGLSERECLGLQDEFHAQLMKGSTTVTKLESKRSPPGGAVAGPPQKVHVSNNYYMTSQLPPPEPAVTQPLGPGTSSPPDAYAPPSQPAIFLPTPPVLASPPPQSPSPTPTALPPLHTHLANPGNTTRPPAIPYHPHPPLKRWPNDYTVAELSAGFNAMELLVHPPDGEGPGPMTQRTAFERVFGSRYVKSTVCRHRGVWRKAAGPLRESFETMGADERACWGEFVRRIEGRAPGKAGGLAMPLPQNGVGAVTTGKGAPQAMSPGLGPTVYPMPVELHTPTDSVPAQSIQRRVGEDKAAAVADEQPVMASLQNPEAL
ncbi:hypothetical protein DXG03_006323 [Asterophora parasitica]|uniref:Uncharacterized protein n=1 Tax=Asterophora parasitica TaxID=117018 RepID=A0A9P7GDK5_9AGAR|nr:hypothetical protein DXG03_006323 [Asterophora parasitica]